MRDPSHDFFFSLEGGSRCSFNWYEGNIGGLGKPGGGPSFTADAHALLGFDESITEYCGGRSKVNSAYAHYNSHAGNCIQANLNILSLFGERVPYNSCRNLEWQVCAALGKLPGQRSRKILFATAPGSLDPSPKSPLPFGQCGGYHDARTLHGADCKQAGFASDDV